jgi:hypothetical protein
LSHEEERKRGLAVFSALSSSIPMCRFSSRKSSQNFEAQDELRRLKKRYAKAGLPLIFIKD